MFLFAISSIALAEVNVLGTVVDGASDHALAKARIFAADSSFLGASNAEGRFELRLQRPLEVTFRREGFRDKVVALADITDLLDLQVAMEPLGTTLEGRSVVTKAATTQQRVGTISELERFGGMRIDLQEHLRNLPGVSGVREFSSDVSIYGSRTHDVAHVLGPFLIPNLRHLDYSFPGNQSVINPRVLDRVSVEHDPIQGPLEQGLASALVYHPLRPATDQHTGVISLGMSNRELDAWGPIGNGTYLASARWLDPSLMTHLASRLFVGSRDQTADQAKNDSTAEPDAEINLQAYDGFLRIEQAAGPLAVNATVLASSDDHTVKVLSKRQGGSESYTRLQQGKRTDLVGFVQGRGDVSMGYLDIYAGTVVTSEQMQLSDTLLRNRASSFSDPTEADWAAWSSDRTDLRAGLATRPSYGLLGTEPELLLAFDQIIDERKYGRTYQYGLGSGLSDERPLFLQRPQSTDLSYSRLHGALRMSQRGKDSLLGASVGGLWTSETEFSPEASISLRAPAWTLGWTLNISRRQSETVTAVDFAKLGVRQGSADEIKLGAGRKVGPVDLTSTVYFRNMDKPQLPVAQPLWVFPMSTQADAATAWGGTLQAKWSTWHTVQAQVNLSRVQGTYELSDGRELDWETNRDFDAWTVVKFHPRSDTLFSIILSHSASIGKPSYRYRIDTLRRTVSVESDPQVQDNPEYADQFRTDLRAELDLPTNLSPLRMIRFYAEIQNIFGQFSGDWARPLGGDNFRQRSWSPLVWQTADGRYGSYGSFSGVRPFYAKGTDLLVTFGIEGRLGI